MNPASNFEYEGVKIYRNVSIEYLQTKTTYIDFYVGICYNIFWKNISACRLIAQFYQAVSHINSAAEPER